MEPTKEPAVKPAKKSKWRWARRLFILAFVVGMFTVQGAPMAPHVANAAPPTPELPAALVPVIVALTGALLFGIRRKLVSQKA